MCVESWDLLSSFLTHSEEEDPFLLLLFFVCGLVFIRVVTSWLTFSYQSSCPVKTDKILFRYDLSFSFFFFTLPPDVLLCNAKFLLFCSLLDFFCRWLWLYYFVRDRVELGMVDNGEFDVKRQPAPTHPWHACGLRARKCAVWGVRVNCVVGDSALTVSEIMVGW